jgi:hypothetical protein
MSDTKNNPSSRDGKARPNRRKKVHKVIFGPDVSSEEIARTLNEMAAQVRKGKPEPSSDDAEPQDDRERERGR